MERIADLEHLETVKHSRDDIVGRKPYLENLVPGDEADAALWIPVSEIFDPGNRTSFRLSLPGGTRDFPAIQVRDLVIWGLTERILQQVAELAGLREGEEGHDTASA